MAATELDDSVRNPESHPIEHLSLQARDSSKAQFSVLHLDDELHASLQVPPLRLWGWEFGNISWCMAQLSLWASVCFMINAHYSLFQTESYLDVYIGLAGIFLTNVGSVLSMWQAVNSEAYIPSTGYDEQAVCSLAADRGQDAVEPLLLEGGKEGGHSGGETAGAEAEKRNTSSSTSTSRGNAQLFGNACIISLAQPQCRATVLERAKIPCPEASKVPPNADPADEPPYSGAPPVEPWRWSLWPSPGQWRDPGYTATVLSLAGAGMYTVAGLVALPGVLEPISDESYLLWYAFNSTPQVVGSAFNIAASWLLMVENQEGYWQPKPECLGWQVSFWSLMGSCALLISGAFTYAAHPIACCQYHGTVLHSYGGSACFLLATYLQLIEVLNPHRPPAKSRLSCGALLNLRFW
ncbi:hypothetical protein JKP88DRAFT_332952 [Tribonema minus]|uniref:Uncharacterized protein n=1 Tax=Tribonema minus TaxID=303371 RepID=A0A835YNX0_9STRA|nr:hypothetical protein JKP88DRAFT_332952 [Tribonema minus]